MTFKILVKNIDFFTPLLNSKTAVSGCPLEAAMCINVLPFLSRSYIEALNLSMRKSTSLVGQML